jgi:hypothetical protein
MMTVSADPEPGRGTPQGQYRSGVVGQWGGQDTVKLTATAKSQGALAYNQGTLNAGFVCSRPALLPK